MTVHFWEITDPRPTFICGRAPEQGVRSVAPAMRLTVGAFQWFRKQDRACKNCLRVMRARAQGRSR